MNGWLNGTFVPANLCVQFNGDANERAWLCQNVRKTGIPSDFG